ncbi:MAG: phage major capsid protein, partial [Bacillota bacterium]|nr:phage major capsid protein [Bacillota bacterium]
MSKILELREKRAKLWESAKAFLDSKRDESGLLSAEDTQSYERMESEVVNLGKEIDRLERQAALDLELSQPVNAAIKTTPNAARDDEKKG